MLTCIWNLLAWGILWRRKDDEFSWRSKFPQRRLHALVKSEFNFPTHNFGVKLQAAGCFCMKHVSHMWDMFHTCQHSSIHASCIYCVPVHCYTHVPVQKCLVTAAHSDPCKFCTWNEQKNTFMLSVYYNPISLYLPHTSTYMYIVFLATCVCTFTVTNWWHPISDMGLCRDVVSIVIVGGECCRSR